MILRFLRYLANTLSRITTFYQDTVCYFVIYLIFCEYIKSQNPVLSRPVPYTHLNDGALSFCEITVHVLNMGLMDNTPTGKLIRTIVLAFAEFERDMIVERTQEGKAIARKQPDYREGRPRLYGRKQIRHALELLKDHSYRQVTEMTGISKSTLIRAKKRAAQES